MTITLPDTVEGFEDFLADSRKLDTLFENGRPKAEFGEFIAGYASKVAARDETIAEQVRDQTAKVLAEYLKENGTAGGRLNLDPQRPVAELPRQRNERFSQVYNREAPGAGVDDLGLNAKDFFRSIWHKADETKDSARWAQNRSKLTEIRNGFSSTVPSDGGFLLPETLRAEILSVALESAIVRPRARVVPMESLKVPYPTVDSTSNASSVYGGIVGYWTEEAGALTQSSAKFGRVVLEAKKLTAYSEVPNELFTDSISTFAAFVDQAFPEAIAYYEDVAFIGGTGAGEPLGWLGSDCSATVTKESGQAASTIKWENIVKMYARMLPGSLGRAAWIANIETFPQLATMSLTLGTGGSAIWLNNGVDGAPMTILGRPVIFTEKVPGLTTSGDINFVDLGYYLIGDRQAMQATSSPHYKFANDQTAIRFIERVDGLPWMQSPITPRKGSATLSPFVKIETR